MVSITEQLCDPSNHGGARAGSPQWIVIHYTANDGDSAQGNANYFRDHVVKASANYFVDDNSIIRTVADNTVAWSVGGAKYGDCASTGGGSKYGVVTNSNSLSIEMCDTDHNGQSDVSQATLDNTIDLVVAKMKEYGIDINHVVRHFDVTGKHCPVYYMDNTLWDGFKALVVSRYNGNNSPATTPAAQSSTTVTNTGNPYSIPTTLVKKGSTGNDAKYVQWAINADGIPCSVDGIFGSGSEAALIKYQSKHGLTADGKAGSATISVMAGTSVSVGAAKNPYTKPTGIIKLGMKGEGVKYVQWAVNNAGFTTAIDGCFGTGTKAQVAAYQSKHGLTADGIVGPATLATM